MHAHDAYTPAQVLASLPGPIPNFSMLHAERSGSLGTRLTSIIYIVWVARGWYPDKIKCRKAQTGLDSAQNF